LFSRGCTHIDVMVPWLNLHSFSLLLFGGLLFTLLSIVLLILSISHGQRSLALQEMRIYVQLEMKERMSSWLSFYDSEDADRLLCSMGWKRWVTGARLKIIRDLISLTLLLFVLTKFAFVGGDRVGYHLILVCGVYSALSPTKEIPSIFTLIIAPFFRKINRYRVSRETSVFLQLLRNEVHEKKERSVLSIIRQYQPYFKIIQDDLLTLEHEWKRGKSLALDSFKARHPGNEEVHYICSVLKELHEIGYKAAAEMLQENEATLNEKQQSHYERREKDLNQLLFIVNIAGVGLALIWAVIGLFLWSYSFDFNY